MLILLGVDIVNSFLIKVNRDENIIFTENIHKQFREKLKAAFADPSSEGYYIKHIKDLNMFLKFEKNNYTNMLIKDKQANPSYFTNPLDYFQLVEKISQKTAYTNEEKLSDVMFVPNMKGVKD